MKAMGGRDEDRGLDRQPLEQGPTGHEGPKGVTHQVKGAGSPFPQEVQGCGHVRHFGLTLAVGPGAAAHAPEIEAQGGKAAAVEGPLGGPDHVVVHAAAEQGVGVGDDHPGPGSARQEAAFQGDVPAGDGNCVCHKAAFSGSRRL